MPALLLLAIAIVGEVVATSALKASAGFTRLAPTLVVLFGYGIAFYFLSLVLDRMPVGVAYAIWAGGGIVLITLAGWFLYGQRPDAAAFLGIAMIAGGVLVINLLSRTSGH